MFQTTDPSAKPDIIVVFPRQLDQQEGITLSNQIGRAFPGLNVAIFGDKVSLFQPAYMVDKQPIPVLSGPDLVLYLDQIREEE